MLVRPLAALLALLALSALPGAAGAAPVSAPAPRTDILPLGKVHAGMSCTGRSVVRGTTISDFRVDVLDVVDGIGESGPRILIRVSGPAVADTGIGEGFSGSPILCPGADGAPRIAGAISEGVGQYGNTVGLATPIEEMLGEQVEPPAGARRASAALLRSRRPLTALTVGGVAAPLRATLAAAAKRAGRTVLAAPAGPAGSFPPQPLVPGASVAAGYATGDVPVSAIGTVTFAGGGTVWGFGHPLDGAGRRRLFLQDAYVYAVIGNPVGAENQVSYKLATAGHVLGTLTADAPSAIAGRLGAPPPSIPLRVVATDLDTGRVVVRSGAVADESGVDDPLGGSVLGLVAPLALSDAGIAVLRGTPARTTARLCVRMELRSGGAPLRFCNRYLAASRGEQDPEGGAVAAASADLSDAVGIVDGARLIDPRVRSVTGHLEVARGLRQAFLVGGTAPARVKAGRRIRVRLRLRRVRGTLETRTIRLRVPRATKPGRRVLRLVGRTSDDDGGDLELSLSDILGNTSQPADDGGDPGPRSVSELRAEVAAISRDDGLRGSISGGTRLGPVFRDRALRISGSLELPLRVRR